MRVVEFRKMTGWMKRVSMIFTEATVWIPLSRWPIAFVFILAMFCHAQKAGANCHVTNGGGIATPYGISANDLSRVEWRIRIENYGGVVVGGYYFDDGPCTYLATFHGESWLSVLN